MQPAMLCQTACARPVRHPGRLLRTCRLVPELFEHLVVALVAEDLVPDLEVLREVRVVRREVYAAARPGDLEVAPLHVRECVGVPDLAHSEIHDAAVRDLAQARGRLRSAPALAEG